MPAPANLSFELGVGGQPGQALSWTLTAVGTAADAPAFTGATPPSVESYELGWSNAPYLTSLGALDTAVAQFTTLNVNPPTVEGFSELWSANQDYITDVGNTAAAPFGAEPQGPFRMNNLGVALPDGTGDAELFWADSTADLVASAIVVSLVIFHQRRGDLQVGLFSPDVQGSDTNVWNNTGGDADDLIGDFAASGFVSPVTLGSWALRVEDTTPGNTGHVRDAYLTLYGSVVADESFAAWGGYPYATSTGSPGAQLLAAGFNGIENDDTEAFEQGWNNDPTLILYSAALFGEASSAFETFESVLAPLPFVVDPSADTLTSVAHPFIDTDRVVIIAPDDGAPPAPLNTTTVYYVRDAAANTFKLSPLSGGAALDLTSTGIGSQRVARTPTTHWNTLL